MMPNQNDLDNLRRNLAHEALQFAEEYSYAVSSNNPYAKDVFWNGAKNLHQLVDDYNHEFRIKIGG